MIAKILCLYSFLLLLTNCSDQRILNSRFQNGPLFCERFQCVQGGIIRGDTLKKELALIFTGDTFSDGDNIISSVLKKYNVKASFFFTGDFYRNPDFEKTIRILKEDGHYLGAHSDHHLLYCSWENRDSLLVSKKTFIQDLKDNYDEMQRFGIVKTDAPFFLPPYEWYNDSISTWTQAFGLQLVNYTSGTRSHADYTTPNMSNYISSEAIFKSILDYESKDPKGLNGFLLLSHIGTDPARDDKFYLRLDELVSWLINKGYTFQRIDSLLRNED